MPSYELITANIATGVQRHVRNGREFLVVPVTMIVPGVLNGSQGALFYPPDEVRKNPTDWDTIPITLGHPSKDGKQISARSTAPEVMRIGTVENSKAQDKLQAEAWIDVLLANRVDSRIVPSILREDKVEISTGLYTDNENVEDIPDPTYNGVPYTKIARNYRPDHLAVLLDQKGACSVDDGCGLNVNKHEGVEMKETERKTMVDLLVNSCCWEEKDRAALNALPDDNLVRLKLKVEEDEAIANALNAAIEASGVDPKLTVNELPEAFKKQIKGKDGKSPAEKAGADDDEEEDDDVKKAKDKQEPKTENTPKWEDIAPAEVLEDLAFARNAKGRMKQGIIDRLTANVDESKKPAQVAVYNAMALDQLTALDPGEPEQARAHSADFAGNAGGVATTPIEVPSKLKPMSTPVINYEDLSDITEGGRPKK